MSPKLYIKCVHNTNMKQWVLHFKICSILTSPTMPTNIIRFQKLPLVKMRKQILRNEARATGDTVGVLPCLLLCSRVLSCAGVLVCWCVLPCTGVLVSPLQQFNTGSTTASFHFQLMTRCATFWTDYISSSLCTEAPPMKHLIGFSTCRAANCD